MIYTIKSLSLPIIIGILSSCSIKKNVDNIPYQKSSDSLLWEISGNGLENPSYLFGTIHLISSKDFYLSEHTKKALNAVDLLVTEIDMQSLYQFNPALLMLPNDSTIKDYMNENEYNKVKQIYIDEMAMTSDVFDKTLARMLPIMLEQQIALLAFGDNTKSYEMEFVKITNKRKVENIGLETQDFQLSILTQAPIKDQINSLITTIDSIDKGVIEMRQLIKLYKEERIHDIAIFMNSAESGKEIMKQKDDFLTNRNLDWIPKIERVINDKSCFIAVGAAHLPTEIGIIELLRNKGYKVKALKN